MSWRRVVAPGLVSLTLAGCGSGSTDDLEQFVARMDARPAPPIQAIPQPAAYVPYRYEPAGRRAIFTPATPAAVTRGNGLQPDRSRALEPLEQFALDDLALVGVLRMHGQARALVRAPDGIVYRLSTGGHVGQNFGRVTAIAADQVSLVEIVPDGQGGYIQRDAVLAAASDSRS